MDNLKLDSKRVALEQKHERRYLKKIAEEAMQKTNKMRLCDSTVIGVMKLRKICEALLKFLKK